MRNQRPCEKLSTAFVLTKTKVLARGQSTLSYIAQRMQPIMVQVSDYLIGDLYRAVTDSSFERELRNTALKQSNGIATAHFGVVGRILGLANVVYVYRSSFRVLINALDKKPDSRLFHRGFNDILGEQALIADTSPHALIQHSTLLKYFQPNPARFATHAEAVVKEIFENKNLAIDTEKASKIILRMMCKSLFDLDQLPPGVNSRLHQVIDVAFKYGLFSYFKGVPGFFQEVKDIHKDYNLAAKALLDTQVDKIKAIFKFYPNASKQNLLADWMAMEIESKHPEWTKVDRRKYFYKLSQSEDNTVAELLENDNVIKTVLFVLSAGKDAVRVLENCIEELRNDPDRRGVIKSHLASKKGWDTAMLMSESDKLKELVRAYVRYIARDDTILRYSREGLAQHGIPPQSLVKIRVGDHPFSEGRRSCPGEQFAMAMVQAVLIEYLRFEKALEDASELRDLQYYYRAIGEEEAKMDVLAGDSEEKFVPYHYLTS